MRIALLILLLFLTAAALNPNSPHIPVFAHTDTLDLGLPRAIVILSTIPLPPCANNASPLPFPEITAFSIDPSNNTVTLEGPPIRLQAITGLFPTRIDSNYPAAIETCLLRNRDPATTARFLNDLFAPTDETSYLARRRCLAYPGVEPKSLILVGSRYGLQDVHAIVSLVESVPITPTPLPPPPPLTFKEASTGQVKYFLETFYGIFITIKNPNRRVTYYAPRPANHDEMIDLVRTIYAPESDFRIATSPPPNPRTFLYDLGMQNGILHIPIYRGNDPAKIPLSDALRTQVIPLRHAKAAAVRRKLDSQLPPNADIGVYERSNSISITATSKQIRHAVELLQPLDR